MKLASITPKINYRNNPAAQARGLRFSTITDREAYIFPLHSNTRINALVDMLFVFNDLGILWLDHKKKIVDKRCAHPFLFYLPTHAATYVIELHPKHLKRFTVGQTLNF